MPQIKIDSKISSKFINFFFGFLYNICIGFFLGTVLSDIVSEKENGTLEMFFVMGVGSFTYWIHWFITHVIISLITSLGLSGIMYANYLAYKSGFGYIFLLNFLILLVNHRLINRLMWLSCTACQYF